MHKRIIRLAAFLVLTILVMTGGTAITYAFEPAPAPQTVNVLVGWGQNTDQLMRFFPANITVRAGDTVAWKTGGQEIHTVSFIGEGGTMNAIPGSLIQDSGDLPGRMIPGFVAPLPNAKTPADVMLNPQVFLPTRQQGAPVEHYSGQGFVSSGVMAPTVPDFLPAGTPANNTFSLVFDKPGTYTFVCLIHAGAMRGTVTVLPADAANVASQADLDAQAQKEIASLKGALKEVRAEAEQVQKDALPNGSSIYYVRAGWSDATSGDLTVQAFDFFPKVATIKAGDTIVWTSTYFHTVTFSPPSMAVPDIAILKAQPSGPPLLLLNPGVFDPARPTAAYDPSKFFNSGVIGLFSPGGATWSLTFDKPGTYTYYCSVHDDIGMKATVVVQ